MTENHPSPPTPKQSTGSKKIDKTNGKEKAKRKKLITVIGLIALIIVIPFVLTMILSESRLQLEISQHPTGYYRIQYYNYHQLPAVQLDFEVLILQGNILIRTLTVVDGIFTDSHSNISAAYYAESQSYACFIADGFKPAIRPIECTENEFEPRSNDVELYKRVDNTGTFIHPTVKISPLGGDYVSFLPDGNWTLEVHQNYSIYVGIANTATYPNEPDVLGRLVVLPDYILETNDDYAITHQINKTNYEGLCMLFNMDLTMLWTSTGYFLDTTHFQFEGQDYTMVLLPPVTSEAGGELAMTFVFQAPTNGSLAYCLWDGAIDCAFDPSYPYFKIGGF